MQTVRNTLGLFAAGLLLWGTPLRAQSGWTQVQSGTTQILRSVTAGALNSNPSNPWFPLNGLRFYAGGDSGIFLASSDLGVSWVAQADTITGPLSSVIFPYGDTGYASSDEGVAYKIRWNPAGYAEFSPLKANFSPATEADFNSVFSLPGTPIVYVAGDSGKIYRSVTRGASFSAHNSTTTAALRGITMATVTRIYAVGDSGIIVRSIDQIGTWQQVAPPSAFAATNFTATAFIPLDTGWVVGENGAIAFTRNRGAVWQVQQSGVTVTLRSLCVRYTSNPRITAWAVGDSGVILRTTDYGVHWERQESGTTANLYSVFFTDNRHGVVVGEGGTILRTSTGGEFLPLSYSPLALDFGPVFVGGAKTVILTLTNHSAAPVDILSAVSSNPAFTISPPSASIPPEGSADFDVTFTPPGKSAESSVITLTGGVDGLTADIGAVGRGADSLAVPEWSWQNPSPQGNLLFDLAFLDPLNGVAVGDAGTVMLTSDAGATWSASHHVAGLGSTLRAVCAAGASMAYAVGDYGVVLRTTDAGANWSRRDEVTPAGDLIAVSFADTSVGYAIGRDSIGYSNALYRTTDGGITWTGVFASPDDPLPGAEIDLLTGVAALSSGTVVAVGMTAVNYGSGAKSGLILLTIDGGSTWERTYPPGSSATLNAVMFADDTIGYAVGNGGLMLRTTDGGHAWESVANPVTADLLDVSFADRDNGTAAFDDGTIMRTTSGGESWWGETIPYLVRTNSVAYTPNGVAVAVGEIWHYNPRVWPAPNDIVLRQDIFRSTDVGGFWTRVTKSVEYNSLRSVSFRDASNGAAISEVGTMLRTTDGGENWTSETAGTLLAYAGAPFIGVCFSAPERITVTGGHGMIVSSPDGGGSWTEQASGTRAALNTLVYADSVTGFIAADSGIILRTTDGGANWSRYSLFSKIPIYGIDCIDAGTAVAVGASGLIVRTSDGGWSWQEMNSHVGVSLRGVAFSGQDGIAVGDDGTVVVTTDGGASWAAGEPGTQFDLLAVDLKPGSIGMAAGAGGTIIRTTDGGLTWATVPSGTNIPLFGISLVDDMIGTVVGGGGVILYTTTGGMPGSAISDIAGGRLPASYSLWQNYPNPFNPATTIAYTLPERAHVRLTVYDVLGRVVAVLADEVKPAGEYTHRWEASGRPTGVYYLRLTAGEFMQTRKLLLMR